ncbi:hypothetical protein ACFQZJ_02815 [Maribacter chungangensis]|uniref:Addiction module protein n=1 Tax=Maribacter chungangensis TaxID=1069117 RepID=A0ABW3B0U8_9FLAO
MLNIRIFSNFELKNKDMDIKASKIELVKMILNINNDTVIKKVLDFVTNEKSDFWNELTESEQVEIQKGIAQLDQGKRMLYKDVLKTIS